MRYSFEKASFINKPGNIGKDVDRLYFGNEFCENLIPDLSALREWYVFAKKKKKDFTFVTPFVTNAGLDRLGTLFTFLNQEHDVEIVFNDWGVFHFLKNNFSNLTPIIGRLLTKQRRDPRISKILLGEQKTFVTNTKKQKMIIFPKKVPPTLFEHHQASVINVPIFQKFLLSQEIKRVEIDNLIWNMNIEITPEIGVSIYFPYGYIATGRMCWKVSLSYSPCKKVCQKYFFRIKHKFLPVPFYSIGNTVFYKSNCIDFDKLKHLKNLRIVYQPKLPF